VGISVERACDENVITLNHRLRMMGRDRAWRWVPRRITTPQRAPLLRATLPCETALWLFLDVDRRRKLRGRARTRMSHLRDWTPGQAERCDGNLPFASRLMHCRRRRAIGRHRLLSKAKSHFPAVAQTVGFGPGRSKMLCLSIGID
jgi:hypothetical protein